jgi:hypothetical protein
MLRSEGRGAAGRRFTPRATGELALDWLRPHGRSRYRVAGRAVTGTHPAGSGGGCEPVPSKASPSDLRSRY